MMILSSSSSTPGAVLLLLLVLVVVQTPPLLIEAQPSSDLPLISYVIEPFEGIDQRWFIRTATDSGRSSATISSDEEAAALFGNGSLHINVTTANSGEDDDGVVPLIDFGWLQEERTMNCHGADYLSLWYETSGAGPDVTVKLSLYEDLKVWGSRYDQAGYENLTLYTEYPLTLALQKDTTEDDDGWKELKIPLTATTDDDTTADGPPLPFGSLQLHRIRGWRFQVLQQATNSSSSNRTTSGTSSSIWLDHMACYGNGEMLGNTFYTTSDVSWTWQELQEQDGDPLAWRSENYVSELSKNLTRAVLHDNVLTINYTVQQVESWGGFVANYITAPGNSYYNLSGATHVAFTTAVQQPPTESDRVHLRLILSESSICPGVNCTGNGLEHESWYSFHYVLDEAAAVDVDEKGEDEKGGTSRELIIPLVGSEGAGTPFWLTGWSGVSGDRRFDIEHIKGYTFEINIGGSEETLGSYVQGIADIYDMKAITIHNENNPNNATSVTNSATGGITITEASAYCRIETEIRLSTTGMINHQFLANQCCETCHADPECLYAISQGFDCFTSNSLTLQQVQGIPNNDVARLTVTTYWMDEPTRRGDFCDLCHCLEATQTIDCRNSQLKIVPKTFDAPWRPRVLDLRNNPNLIILGGGALDEIAESLEELWLPKELALLAPESLIGLNNLQVVHFEDDENDNDNDNDHEQFSAAARQNFISERTAEAFGDVCCTPGDQLELLGHGINNNDDNGGITTLTFCNMSLYQPGIDATYIPFNSYQNAVHLKTLRPNSPFLSEASENVEKCAEACTISAGCHYYHYDARVRETEHTCYLLQEKGSGLHRECCNPRHYADEEETIPGLIAGLPPRTRHIDDMARVKILEGQNLILEESNGYQAYFKLALGSTPTRGAVWITPIVLSTLKNMEVHVSPRRVVLYDENRTATVTVSVVFRNGHPESDATSTNFVIRDEIESCDVAFTSSLTNTESTIFVDVVLPKTKTSSYTISNTAIILICVGIIILLVVAMGSYTYLERKQGKNDAVWQVQSKELHFDEPPEILGRGTFGMVLAAEYRGTRVAVKRVIPKRANKKVDRLNGRRSSGYLSSGSSNYFDDSGALEEKNEGTKTLGEMDNSFSKQGSVIMGNAPVADSRWNSGTSSARESSREQAALWKKLKSDFVREMRHLSKLRHPCVTTVMGAVIDTTSDPCLVMELMDHGSLYDLLHNDTVVIEGEVLLPILRDVSQGMRFLHAATPQVIHGDLKAGNILVDCKFRAKIADFGLSQKKYVGATGTPYWMAPELLRGIATNTPPTDVYSFGIVLFEVYSRKDPYEGEDFREVIRLIIDRLVNKRPPIPLNMPDTVQTIMMDCLREDPSARPTFRLLDQLLNEVNSQSVEPINKEAMTRQRSARNLLFRQSVSLEDIFPKHIAEALKEGRKTEAERHEMVTIFFSDIVGFTTISADMDPHKVADMLDRLYNAFDSLADKHDIYKVDTIGDAYMCATNLVKKQPDDHVARIALFAVEAIEASKKVRIDLDDPTKGYLEIRAGFHSGPCVADVIGTSRPVFTLFGDTVNTASRMESSGDRNRIHCSKTSADLLSKQLPALPLSSRGPIAIKGKGEEHTYWVNEVSSNIEDDDTTAREQANPSSWFLNESPPLQKEGSPSSPPLVECPIAVGSSSDEVALSMVETGEATQLE